MKTTKTVIKGMTTMTMTTTTTMKMKRAMNQHRPRTKRMTFLIPFPVKPRIDNRDSIIDFVDDKNGI